MKKIIPLLVALLLVGCGKTASKHVIKFTLGDETKYISYNEMYRDFDKYTSYSAPKVEFPLTIVSYSESHREGYDIDSDKFDEWVQDPSKDLSDTYIYYTVYSYKIYGYVGNNENNIVDVSYDRIVYKNGDETEPKWRVKKGDVVNFSGYMRMREEMTEYKHNGESTMAPVLVPIVEEYELLE